jgi:hypothetical protein
MNSIGLVYLFYTPYGIRYLKMFLESLAKCNSLSSIDVYIIVKGDVNKWELNQINEYLRYCDIKAQITMYDESGYDLDAYLYISSKIQNTNTLFFNTKSKILNQSFLIYLLELSEKKNTIVSSTSSFQSHYSTVFQTNKWYWEFNKSFSFNFRKYKLFAKAFFYWQWLFPKFPNPHIRTNAFMVNREAFLKLKIKLPLKNKFAAYLLESGRSSITNQFMKMGYSVGVLDKHGKIWDLKECHKSNTFWQGNQENLLVADNQTEIYANATEQEKKQMQYLAWGIK